MKMMIDCFHKALERVVPIPDEHRVEAREIYENDSFSEFLDYCRECGCFGHSDERTDLFVLISYGVCDYEAGDSNYYEENAELKSELLDVLFDE